MIMLEIHYVVAGSKEEVKKYDKASDFVGAQYKEVPDLQDNYHVAKVLLAGKEIELDDKTIGGLFNYLNK